MNLTVVPSQTVPQPPTLSELFKLCELFKLFTLQIPWIPNSLLQAIKIKIVLKCISRCNGNRVILLSWM